MKNANDKIDRDNVKFCERIVKTKAHEHLKKNVLDEKY